MEHKIEHLEEVDHSYIRYANVWEDPYLLLEGLQIESHHKVLSIASAGDNAFALLAAQPKLCVAIDLNRVQLYLTELKKVAIAHLSQSEFLAFAGFTDSSDRMEQYNAFKEELSREARIYWDENEEAIKNGIIFNGKFEKYLATFARKVLPFIHRKKTVKALFKDKSAEEQKGFFEKHWNTWTWKFLFKIFFSKRIMGWLGRDPAFLAQVNVDVGKVIMEKAAIHLSSKYAQQNPMLYYCLNGHFGSHLPFYAREEQYKKVKSNLDALKIEYGYAQDAGNKYGNFDRFNLSNIFEYMDDKVFESTSKKILEIANKGAKIAYWNLMVKREISSISSSATRISDLSKWAERDQGFFYMQFIVEELNG